MKIKCPACTKVLSIPETAAGKVVKCPCGKQLRVPVGKTGGSPSAKASPTPAAGRPAAADPFGSDPKMFDELTANDLEPVKSVSTPYATPPKPTSGNDVLQGYAPPSAAGQGSTGSVGVRATLGQRVGGAMVDVIFSLVLGIPGLVAVALILAALDIDPDNSPFLLVFYAPMFVPTLINAYLISVSGQSVGKKIAKTRIVDRATGSQSGFVQGFLLRSFVFGIITSIPCVGAIIALVDLVMLFIEPHETLHDKLAKTVVVQA